MQLKIAGGRMKKQIFIFLIICAFAISAQTPESGNPRKLKIGLLAGVGTQGSQNYGTAFLLEARYPLADNINIKFTYGFSNLKRNEDYNIKTYFEERIGNVHQYVTNLVEIVRHDYAVNPVSFGIDYIFTSGVFEPFCFFETGYNSYRTKVITGTDQPGVGGIYTSDEDIPAEYKDRMIKNNDGTSFRFAIGTGIKYKSVSFCNIDIRYLYEINTSLVNNHLIMIGVSLK